MDLDRRSLLRTSALGVAAIAGCTTDQSGDDAAADGTDGESPGTTNESDGEFSSYETIETMGQTVPLLPVDEAYEWYQDESARFADARGELAYRNTHISGAVWSPAPDGRANGDPVERWPSDQRIVCYCGCPHHLSGQRAASLLSEGYAEVYAIDEGLGGWYENGYPLVGEESEQLPEQYTISGETESAEDAYAWAWHDPTGQREAAPIDAEGNYELHLRFDDVDESSTIRVATPSYEVEKPLGELVDGTVAAP